MYDSLANTMSYYGEQERPLAEFPFNFLLVTELSEKTSAQQLKDLINSWMDAMPAGACANWVVSFKVNFIIKT